MEDEREVQPEIILEFDAWLNEKTKSEKGVYVVDLVVLCWSLFTRLRTVLTLNELHAVIHEGMAQVERRIREGTALLDPETGEYTNLVTAEEGRLLNAAGGAQITDEALLEWIKDDV